MGPARAAVLREGPVYEKSMIAQTKSLYVILSFLFCFSTSFIDPFHQDSSDNLYKSNGKWQTMKKK